MSKEYYQNSNKSWTKLTFQETTQVMNRLRCLRRRPSDPNAVTWSSGRVPPLLCPALHSDCPSPNSTVVGCGESNPYSTRGENAGLKRTNLTVGIKKAFRILNVLFFYIFWSNWLFSLTDVFLCASDFLFIYIQAIFCGQLSAVFISLSDGILHKQWIQVHRHGDLS